MIVELLIFIITFGVAYFLYLHYSIVNGFKRKDVKVVPGIPLFGNAFGSTLGRKHVWEDIDAVYRAFPDEKYVGYIENTTPVILVRDPDLIKQITVKDFDHFVDRKEFFSEDVEPLFGGSILMMKGDKWRDMRATLSPAFTGSKMRLMMPFMTEISNNVISYLKENVGSNEELNVDDVIRRYTNDVIASTGFGLQINSFKDKDNEFFTLGQKMFSFTPLQRLYILINIISPTLAQKLNIKILPDKITNFFTNLVQNTISFRKTNKLERPDMIQLLMEASKGNLKPTQEKDEVLKPREDIRNWTLNELSGQVFIFFVAGFESSATALILAIHELALHPEAQEKLYQEVKRFKETHGQLTYENINQLNYLDCVLNETMRKWSPGIFMDRICTVPYVLPPPHEGGKLYKLNKGDLVYNMLNSVQLDPKHFPDPNKFDPERFSDDNKHNIKPFTFMPFGMGPRNCIGSRFALLELKVLMYDMALNFKMEKGPKTSSTISLDPENFSVKPKGGTFVRLVKRN